MNNTPTRIDDMRKSYKNVGRFENIPVFKSEIKVLKSLKDADVTKLMFVILLLSKCNKYGNTPCDDAKIAKIAKVKKWKKDIGEMLQPYISEDEQTEGYLLQFRFVKHKDEYRPYYYVLFAVKKRRGQYGRGQKPYIIIDSIDTCIDELFEKTDIFQSVCYNCGKKFFNSDKKRKYCSNCTEKVKKKRDRHYARVRRFKAYMGDRKESHKNDIETSQELQENKRLNNDNDDKDDIDIDDDSSDIE